MLDQTKLKNDIEDILVSEPTSFEVFATQMAQAYYDYAQDGTFGASTTTIPTANRDAMKTTIQTALATNTAVAFVIGFDTSLTAFWTAVPVAGASGTGVTEPPTSLPSSTTLVASLVANAANNNATKSMAANDLATALHTSTLTVSADLTLPPAGPVPTPIS